MKKLAEKFATWSEFKQILFVLIVVALLGAIISCIFIFVENVGVLWGWLLGSAVNLFAYITIYKGSAAVLNSAKGHGMAGGMAIALGGLRFLFYAGALLLSGFASFKWGSLAHGYCNLISCALALMPTWITLVIVLFFRAKKAEKKPNPTDEGGAR